MKPTPTDVAFERLARAFLDEHLHVPREWRNVKAWGVGRTDLICGAGTRDEVFASFNRGGQIAVGVTAAGGHEDFDDFGRGRSDEEIAQEAFDHFVDLLVAHGHVPAAR